MECNGKAVYKYRLKLVDITEVDMPDGAEILCCQMQHDTICLWALVDPKADRNYRAFAIYGTGHSIVHDTLTYIATVQQGPYVWHVFEIPSE